LQSVTANYVESREFKTVFRITDLRAKNVSQDIGFAATPGAGACPPQKLQIKIGFAAVIPADGEFVPDLLNVSRL
jgi:hypothetical protein